MIKQKSKGILTVVSAPSGAGKDTVCNYLTSKNKNIWLSISCTSRKPRKNEKEGKDYYFLTKKEFEQKIEENKFLEYAKYNNNYYGTPKDKINNYLNKGVDVILVVEVEGALQIKEKIKEALFIFIMPPSMQELKKRLENRGTETKTSILNRFKTAYNEINQLTKYNYVVINDEIEKAAKKIESIIIAEKCRVDRIEEVYLNNKEEILHELLIEKELENKQTEII